MEDTLAKVLKRVEKTDECFKEIQLDISGINQKVELYLNVVK